MKGMRTCSICGREFALMIEERYTAKDTEKTGLTAAFSSQEPALYDAFDCPWCGCQNVVQERKMMFSADPEKECPCDYGICDECDHDGCTDCAWEDNPGDSSPCNICAGSHHDYWKKKEDGDE